MLNFSSDESIGQIPRMEALRQIKPRGPKAPEGFIWRKTDVRGI